MYLWDIRLVKKDDVYMIPRILGSLFHVMLFFMKINSLLLLKICPPLGISKLRTMMQASKRNIMLETLVGENPCMDKGVAARKTHKIVSQTHTLSPQTQGAQG